MLVFDCISCFLMIFQAMAELTFIYSNGLQKHKNAGNAIKNKHFQWISLKYCWNAIKNKLFQWFAFKHCWRAIKNKLLLLRYWLHTRCHCSAVVRAVPCALFWSSLPSGCLLGLWFRYCSPTAWTTCLGTTPQLSGNGFLDNWRANKHEQTNMGIQPCCSGNQLSCAYMIHTTHSNDSLHSYPCNASSTTWS